MSNIQMRTKSLCPEEELERWGQAKEALGRTLLSLHLDLAASHHTHLATHTEQEVTWLQEEVTSLQEELDDSHNTVQLVLGNC